MVNGDILYINAASIIAHIDEIHELITRRKPILLAVSETCVTNQIEDSEIECEGYNCIRVDSHSRMTGGCCVYVREDLNIVVLEQTQHNQAAWALTIKIKFKDIWVGVSVFYRSPSTNKNDFLQFFDEWLEVYSEQQIELLICGDFNIDLMKNDAYSNKLKNMINFYGMKQHIKTPTRITESTSTIIDLVMSNFIVHATVELCDKISDHNTIKIQSDKWKIEEKDSNFVNKLINYSGIKLRTKLQTYDWRVVYNSEDVETKAELLTDRLFESMQTFIKKVHIKIADNEWYGDNLKNMRIMRDNAYKLAALSRCQDDWLRYRTVRNNYSAKIRETKKNHIEEKLLEAGGDSKRTWKILKTLLNGKKECKIERMEFDGQLVEDSAEIASKYNNFVVNSIKDINSSINSDNLNNNVDVTTNYNARLSFTCATHAQIIGMLKEMKKKRDLHGVAPRVLLDAWPIIGDIVIDIINESLKKGIFPNVWKISTVVPIPKVDKSVKCTDFRPINMLLTVEKLLETVVKEQLVNYIESNMILIETQSGYRKRFSCETAINLVITKWKKFNDDNNDIICVFLDLKRAFETLDRQRLISKLSAMGIQNFELKWFESYLSNRKQRVKIGELTSTEIDNDIGTPQGSVLGAILFVLYINDLPTVVKFCEVNLFADDTLIFGYGKDVQEIIKNVQNDLNNINEYMNKNKLKLNVDKTKCIMIKGKRTHDLSQYNIEINGAKIEKTDQIKYLGVIIDDQLNFKENNLYISKKVAKKIGFFARIAKNMTTSAKINVYKSIIAPHFDYCSSLLFVADGEDSNMFQKLQNRAMRVVLGCNKYTSIAFMTDALQWQTVKQRVVSRTMQFVFKVKNDMLPRYLTEFLRYNSDIHTYPSRRKDDFRIPQANKSSTRRNVFYAGLKFFNEMPEEIKIETSFAKFKKLVNKYVKIKC